MRTTGKQCGLAATGVYQPSLRSPWLAAIETHLSSEVATPASDRKFSDAVLLPDLGDSPDDQEVLHYALYREHTAMEQYQSLAETAPDGALRDLFRFLAKEETAHKNELEKLYYEVVHSGGI